MRRCARRRGPTASQVNIAPTAPPRCSTGSACRSLLACSWMKPNYCPQNTGATYCKTRLIRGNVKPRFQSWGQLTKKKQETNRRIQHNQDNLFSVWLQIGDLQIRGYLVHFCETEWNEPNSVSCASVSCCTVSVTTIVTCQLHPGCGLTPGAALYHYDRVKAIDSGYYRRDLFQSGTSTFSTKWWY